MEPNTTSDHPTTDERASHTPGPWIFEPSDWSIRVREWKRNRFMGDYRGCIVADLSASIGHSPEGQSRREAIPEMKANARLIAAAPDLLALAKQYASECAGCNGSGVGREAFSVLGGEVTSVDIPCEDCADIRKVIAKVEDRL